MPSQEKGKTLTFHPALYRVVNSLRKAHPHIKPAQVAFRNAKTLKDNLLRSKLSAYFKTEVEGVVDVKERNVRSTKY